VALPVAQQTAVALVVADDRYQPAELTLDRGDAIGA